MLPLCNKIQLSGVWWSPDRRRNEKTKQTSRYKTLSLSRFMLAQKGVDHDGEIEKMNALDSIGAGKTSWIKLQKRARCYLLIFALIYWVSVDGFLSRLKTQCLISRANWFRRGALHVNFAAAHESLTNQIPPFLFETHSDENMIDAAASVTQETYSLLGVKSIGVDYGLVRTGVAVTVGYDPKPLTILKDLNATEVCDAVIRCVRLEQASRIVVGLPLHKNGTIAEQTNLTLVFVAELAQKSLQELGPGVKVELFDERYTSKAAAARAHSRNPHQPLYGTLDADAACIILENYYNDNGLGAQPAHLRPDIVEESRRLYERKTMDEDARLKVVADQRVERVRRRREEIEQDKQLQAAIITRVGASKKKKKKKKKR